MAVNLSPVGGVAAQFFTSTGAVLTGGKLFTYSAGSTTGWNAGPEGVMVWSDQPCYVEVGEGAVATTASTPIPAYTPIPFKVPIGTSAVWRVSAIQVSTGGTVYAKPINTK